MSNQSVDHYEIERLSEELENLIIDFEERSTDLQEQINYLRTSESPIRDSQNDDEATESPIRRLEQRLKVGDRVTITNTYKNLQGTTGTIIKVTAKTVLIAEDDSNRKHRRLFKNVKPTTSDCHRTQ